MLFQIRVLLRTLILPPACLLLLAFAGLGLVRRRRGAGIGLITASLAALWLLSMPWVADGLERTADHYPALNLSHPLNAGAIVILGGGGYRSYAPEFRGPAPEYAMWDRLAYGAYVARYTRLPVLVTGNGMEAITMRVSLERDFGVRAKWVEDHSLDTYDNARNSARILLPAGIRHIILITSATHLWRATHEFQGAGLSVVPAPAGLWAPREHGIQRYLPLANGLRRSCAAIYAIVGEHVSVMLEALHLRSAVG